MKRVIATTEMYRKPVTLEMESYDDALEFCRDNNIPESSIANEAGDYFVNCREYLNKSISGYEYCFDIYSKFGSSTSKYVSSVHSYVSKCADYTSLNKEYLLKKNLPRNYYIYKPSLRVINTYINYKFDHYGM